MRKKGNRRTIIKIFYRGMIAHKFSVYITVCLSLLQQIYIVKQIRVYISKDFEII